MEKSRKVKMLSIVALVLAITGMSLGFAAFSSTLNISSSATVTPNSDDFSVEILGMDWSGEYSLNDSIIAYCDGEDFSMGYAYGSDATVTNGKVASISNISIRFTNPGDSVNYPFIIKNTGLYTTYMRSGSVKVASDENSPIICSPADGSEVTDELLNSACEGIDVSVYFSKGTSRVSTTIRNFYRSYGSAPIEFSSFTDPFIIEPGEYIIANYIVVYDRAASRADGAFNVKIADFELTFSTAPSNI